MGEGPEAGVVKVADFGLARFFQACEMSFTMNIGAHAHAAPAAARAWVMSLTVVRFALHNNDV
jgi:hypothetical protein